MDLGDVHLQRELGGKGEAFPPLRYFFQLV